MRRALEDHQKPTLRTDGTHCVPSKSTPGAFHTVTVDEAGHIVHCTCKGWERYGPSNPCRHAGAVALARLYMLGAHIVNELERRMSELEEWIEEVSQDMIERNGG